MAITGASARECAEKFREHISAVTSQLLDCPTTVRETKGGATVLLKLGHDHVRHVSLNTADGGALFLQLNQTLRVEKCGRREFRLRTEKYRYAIYHELSDDQLVVSDALFRWERDPVPRGKAHCRDHIQIGFASVTKTPERFNLNRLHMPTGVVLIEHVLRFIINDFGVKPSCDDWSSVLAESEHTFHNSFDG